MRCVPLLTRTIPQHHPQLQTGKRHLRGVKWHACATHQVESHVPPDLSEASILGPHTDGPPHHRHNSVKEYQHKTRHDFAQRRLPQLKSEGFEHAAPPAEWCRPPQGTRVQRPSPGSVTSTANPQRKADTSKITNTQDDSPFPG